MFRRLALCCRPMALPGNAVDVDRHISFSRSPPTPQLQLHGKTRHREGPQRHPGRFIPKNVRKVRRPRRAIPARRSHDSLPQRGHDFLFPNARIRDSVRAGGEVWVDVSTARDVDDRGGVGMSVWGALAFSHSEATRNKCVARARAPWSAAPRRAARPRMGPRRSAR